LPLAPWWRDPLQRRLARCVINKKKKKERRKKELIETIHGLPAKEAKGTLPKLKEKRIK